MMSAMLAQAFVIASAVAGGWLALAILAGLAIGHMIRIADEREGAAHDGR